MAGSTHNHNLIQGDLGFGIKSALRSLKSSCDTVGSNQKIYVAPRTIFYPDLTVICGNGSITAQQGLKNPVAVFEVLSPSTQAYDRTGKFEAYKQIESLRHYVLLEQDRPTVTHYVKGDNGAWTTIATHNALTDSLQLTLGGATVTVPLAHI